MTNPINRQCPQCQATIASSTNICHICKTPITTNQPKQEPLKLIRVHEQSQGAYSILIPQGWRYAASIQLYPDGNAVSTWQVRDPSGTITLSCPGTTFSFQEPIMALFGQILPGRRPMQYMPA